jgi:hypothetical protein
MKYIFVAGAPGSKWSSVVKNIYYSPDVDRSDYSDTRTYYHDASGKRELMHLGAYFDPGMEFNLPDNLFRFSKSGLEDIFNSAFSGSGVRIVKSHIFALNIDFLRACWPDSPVVLVHRPDDACLGWWVKCGHFDITYHDYAEYYRNLREMSVHIQKQNTGITDAIWNYKHKNLQSPANNYELCDILGLAQPPSEYLQNYTANDITVRVII